MKKLQAVTLTAAAIKKVLADESTSKSSKMKALFDAGFTVKEIAAHMQVRYNFAYNVISNYVNMQAIELEVVAKDNKKEKIIEMHLQQKSNKEISIELKTNYNYVYNTIKSYKLNQTAQAE
jgi:predicted transcriptional regulator